MVDPTFDSVLSDIEKLKTEDTTEDATYEATIAQLQKDLAALKKERDALVEGRKAVVAELIVLRDLLSARIVSLGR